MTIAEICGKISETGANLSDRMEDLLTSDVFGCLRYVPSESGLLPFLRTARSFRGSRFLLDAEVVRVHWSFWPWLNLAGRSPCEPDVVLGLETVSGLVHIVMVEAKYRSGLTDEEDDSAEPRNQLARELDSLTVVTPANLGWPPALAVASRALLHVTPDVGMPRRDLRTALDEYARKLGDERDIFWASWRFLPSLLESSLAGECNRERRAVPNDMLRLLLRKGLVMFHGVEPIERRFAIEFGFQRSHVRIYEWPGVPEPSEALRSYGYEVAKRDSS